MKRKLFRFIYVTTLIVIVFTVMLTNPVWTSHGDKAPDADSLQLKQHVRFLSELMPARNYQHTGSLDQAASYIFEHFKKHADTVWYQSYEYGGRTYRNIVCSFGTSFEKRIVVGAHYDVFGDLPGADDNASGTAGILEIARLLKIRSAELSKRIDIVAYTLEEPPFFRTDEMGSVKHVKYLKANNIEVEAMICLEMIGYFSEQKDEQEYPSAVMRLFYPSHANYIAVVGRMRDWSLTRDVKKAMIASGNLAIKSINGFSAIPGIDLSDHRSYWNEGIDAVMITNTAFFRNHNYHTEGDIWQRLDYSKMAIVVQGVTNFLLGKN